MNKIPYVFVPITQNKVTIVDADMAEYAMSHNWYFKDGYASRNLKIGEDGCTTKKRPIVSLQHAVCPCPKGMVTDHINRNRLDNRRINLRCATPSQNAANSVRRRGNIYRGVSKDNDRGWRAAIGGVQPGIRSTYLGSFKTPEDAARAYDRAALERYGEFAVLNFPD